MQRYLSVTFFNPPPFKYTGKVAKAGAFFYSMFAEGPAVGGIRRSMSESVAYLDVHLFSTAILPLSNASKF